MAVAIAADLGEPLEREPCGFADPCTQYQFIPERGWRFVIDLVPQNHPTNALLRFRAGDRAPVSRRDFLDPSQVNNVVYVILLVDVRRLHGNDHFKTRGRHQKFRIKRKCEFENSADGDLAYVKSTH
jgi:hypothetical protein